jgi:hypothetical protein
MKKQKIKYLLMLLASSFSMMRIQATPQSWIEYIASFACTDLAKKAQSEEQKRKEVEQKLKQETMAAYQQEAMGLRDVIFNKYKQGTLSSGVPLAKADSIAVSVLDPNMPEPEMPDLSERDDAKWKASYDKYRKEIELWVSAQGLKDAHGVMRRSKVEDDQAPRIYLSSKNNDYGCEFRNRVMLHEIAHALDGCLRRPKDQQYDCYAWLHGDVGQHKNHSEIDISEWHADKQAAWWMKEHWPEEAKFMKAFYKYCSAQYGEESGFKYAPYAKLVEWFSVKKDPLRMKEIKKAGLLWNM